MLFSSAVVILASAGLIEAGSVRRHIDHHMIKRQNGDSTATTLAADAIATGSFVDGGIKGVQADGQAASATSKNNFINICSGKTLTNGAQVVAGSCNGIPMGDIPAKTAMVSSMITFPETGGDAVKADTTFDITVIMSNMVTGSFTNATSTYYAAPQALEGGKIVGHTHVTVQDLGNSLNPKTFLDPTQFAFFKGINTAANGQGVLSATVTGGLPAGNYRVCTLASASNHQPVLMPVAQRGTADDCVKFVVDGAGAATNGGATTGGNTGNAGKGAAASSAAASSATKASATKAKATKTAKAGTGGKAAKATKAAAQSDAIGVQAAASSDAIGVQAAASSSAPCGVVTGTVTVDAPSIETKAAATTSAFNFSNTTTPTAAASAAATTAATSGSTAGAVGGIAAPAITDSGNKDRPFEVNGNTFVNEGAAKQRSCDIQFNACANAVNGGKANGFVFADCTAQQTTCNAA